MRVISHLFLYPLVMVKAPYYANMLLHSLGNVWLGMDNSDCPAGDPCSVSSSSSSAPVSTIVTAEEMLARRSGVLKRQTSAPHPPQKSAKKTRIKPPQSFTFSDEHIALSKLGINPIDNRPHFNRGP